MKISLTKIDVEWRVNGSFSKVVPLKNDEKVGIKKFVENKKRRDYSENKKYNRKRNIRF